MASAAPMGGAVTANPMQQASMAQQGALAGTAANMAYRPMSIQAGQIADANIAQYQNPYTEQVIRANEADILRGAQMGINALDTAATRAGAFGGSRHGVALGEYGRGIAEQLAQSSAGLRQSGFQNAQQMAQADIANRMAAQQANQQAQLAGAQHRLGAAGQLATLGQQSFGYGQNIQQQLAQQGAQQQALNQALIDAAKGQYGAYTQFPAAGLSLMTQALGASPHGQTSTSSSNPGAMGVLSAGMSMMPYLMGMPSDRRLKKNITLKDILPNGIKVYKWEWNDLAHKLGKASNMVTGVIAQEVAERFPEAVMIDTEGYLKVNYAHPELRGAA